MRTPATSAAATAATAAAAEAQPPARAYGCLLPATPGRAGRAQERLEREAKTVRDVETILGALLQTVAQSPLDRRSEPARRLRGLRRVLRVTEGDARVLAKIAADGAEAARLAGQMKTLDRYTAFFVTEGKRPRLLELGKKDNGPDA
jgi:hypothetical protein